MGSFDQGVSWFCWLFIAQVKPPPSVDTWKPNDGLAMTLIQGAGVQSVPLEDRYIFAAVRAEAAEPVEEFERRARQGGSAMQKLSPRGARPAARPPA